MGFLFNRGKSVPKPDPTAIGAALCRVLEQGETESQRLFRDPFVRVLLGPYAGAARGLGTTDMLRGQIDGVAPGLYGSQVCRTRYIDDAVLDTLRKRFAQVAIVGAGYDTRAYRLAGIDKARVVEFDLPATLHHKRLAIEARLGELPTHVTYAELDLESPSAITAFTDAGIVATEPTVVICEGVTQYISAAAVDRLLAATAALCTGSVIVFTYVLDAVLRDSDGIASASRQLARGGPQWVFGLKKSDVPSLLRAAGLKLVEDVGADEYQDRYLAPIGRRLAVSPYERIVKAVVA